MITIGSHALAAHGVDIGRLPKDRDTLCTRAEYLRFVIDNSDKVRFTKQTRRGFAAQLFNEQPIEFEIAEGDNLSAQLVEIICDTPGLLTSKGGIEYVSPDVVYTMKMSHRFLKNSPHFRKTMLDIKLLRDHGCTVPSVLAQWSKDRARETYDYGHPSLAQSKDNFFKDDNVGYIYDHDTLHEAVKTFHRPAFEYIKADTAEVFCSKEKFFGTSDEVRLATVVEESLVLALERHQIPNGFKPDPKQSFLIALEKVCTSISSGWWRDYAWEHYDAVVARYPENYIERFNTALHNGMVQPYRRAA